MRVIGSCLLTMCLLAGTGCVYRLGDFTAVSTKNVPITYSTPTTATGRSCRVNVLGIPLGLPSLKEAADDAIGSRGNALVNEVTYTTEWTTILFGEVCFEVKGDVVTLQ